MQRVNQGTKLDSFAIELTFEKGLIKESHPLWLDGFSVKADSNNKECGSKGRNSDFSLTEVCFYNQRSPDPFL